jgi:hypothetical protein
LLQRLRGRKKKRRKMALLENVTHIFHRMLPEMGWRL